MTPFIVLTLYRKYSRITVGLCILFVDGLPAHDRRQVSRGHRQVPQHPVECHPVGCGHKTGNHRGAAATWYMPRVCAWTADGEGKKRTAKGK